MLVEQVTHRFVLMDRLLIILECGQSVLWFVCKVNPQEKVHYEELLAEIEYNISKYVFIRL